jgi:hypothetical protein
MRSCQLFASLIMLLLTSNACAVQRSQRLAHLLARRVLHDANESWPTVVRPHRRVQDLTDLARKVLQVLPRCRRVHARDDDAVVRAPATTRSWAARGRVGRAVRAVPVAVCRAQERTRLGVKEGRGARRMCTDLLRRGRRG